MKSTKKRILVFSDWYLPGFKAGGPITSLANLVRHLCDEYEFFIVCRDRDYLETAPYPGISQNKWVPSDTAQIYYLSPDKFNRRKIEEVIHEVTPDAVYINGIFSKVFSIFPLVVRRKGSVGEGIRTVVAPRGMLAPSALGIKGLKKKAYLRSAKVLRLFRNVRFHATTEEERDQVNRWFGSSEVRVIENIPGVRGEIFPPKNKVENVLDLYAVSRIAPEKNIAFAIDCLKGVPESIAVRYSVVGSFYQEAYAKKCRKLARETPPNVTVEFVSPLAPGEISKFASERDAFFLPTRGENYGHAIIEAMLMGKPVIISDQTPWRGLAGMKMGFDLPLSRRNFIDVIVELAEMNGADYSRHFRHLDKKALDLIDAEGICQRYKVLFDG